MKYAPDLPPPAAAPATGPEVKALAAVKRARPVRERTLPPLVVRPQVRRETSRRVAEEEEGRHDPRLHGERRVYCRRIERRPVLTELRSGRERRRHNQRAGDMTEHVDVEA